LLALLRTFILYPFVSVLQEARDLLLIFLGLDLSFRFPIESNEILALSLLSLKYIMRFSRSERGQSQAPLVLRFD
jgi:hypothetical protein